MSRILSAAVLARNLSSIDSIPDSELRRMVDELERWLRVARRTGMTSAAHYSVGDYLKYQDED